jgi:UDP-N-acetylglucosamine 2-epimerase (non-hydrolysing)/GDP/UDP-N,N'-diacetylbacillosamine 2-epimerase (hydrolysing)
VDIVANYNPDLIIYAGDREEVIIASLIGGYLEIPTMHFFGGDHVKDSHIDNPIRHATSKLSTIHMVSHKEHAQRLIRMGESEDRVYNIGSIALDKFINESTRSKNEIRKYFKINHGLDSFAVVIFHPIPKERDFSADIFENILLSLKERNIYAFVSYPNIDPGNREIIKIIDKYQNDVNFLFYRNQPRSIFISIYKNATFIIGNSSSGILESASIPIPAINVGYRQTGRLANENVVFANGEISSIVGAIDKVQSKEYEKIIKNVKNIYGDGHSSEKALNIIKNNDFNSLIFKDEDILENASQ